MRVFGVPDQLHQTALGRLAGNDRRAVLAGVQQAFARRHVQLALDLLAAVAFHALVEEERADVIGEELEAVVSAARGSGDC